MNFTATTTNTISEHQIANLLVGLNETFPFACFKFYHWPYADDPADNHKLVLNLPIVVLDLEDPAKHSRYPLDEAKLQAGLQIMADKYPEHFHNLVTENDDVETADCFLQCCCFGDMIYG